MILGNKKFFTQEHFEKHRQNADRYLVELVIYCLEFVSLLAQEKLKFRFKGGNSLLIITQKPGRFSIDVDIATSESKKNLIETVLRVVEQSGVFSRCEVRQHKTKPWLPMISFNIFFDSVYQNTEDSFIMLDAVLREAPSAGEFKKVECGEIYSSDSEVEVSTIEGLIGDKLLTLGPATLGIPLGKNKEAQRLKHVFDIGLLSSLKEELNYSQIRESIQGCLAQENQIQQTDFNYSDVKTDTIEFCLAPKNYSSPPDLSNLETNSYIYEIVRGFSEFQGFILKKQYSWQSLLEDLNSVHKIFNKVSL